MVAYDIVITSVAEDDLYEIRDYIWKELLEPETARNVIGRIAEAVYTLKKMPERHALINDSHLAQSGIRYLQVGNYIVFYTVEEKNHTVTIIRILYNKRNWITLLFEK